MIFVEAFHRKRVDVENFRRTVQSETLNEIINATTRATNSSKLLDITLEHILKGLDLKIGAIWIPPHSSLIGLPPEKEKKFDQGC